MWREWIEIEFLRTIPAFYGRLPPCGGSGLKFRRLNEQVKDKSLPPCGGSGLKCDDDRKSIAAYFSLPPCGGSGLKSACLAPARSLASVSLRVEGVD